MTKLEQTIANIRQQRARLDQLADESRERVLRIVKVRPGVDPLPPASPAWLNVEHVIVKRRTTFMRWHETPTTFAEKRGAA